MKRIGRIEYHFIIRHDAANEQYEQHIVNIRFVGESTSMSYKFTDVDNAMRFIYKISGMEQLHHS